MHSTSNIFDPFDHLSAKASAIFARNELLLDDLAESEKINLHTKNQKNILTLDSNSDGHKLALRSEEGRAEFYAKKTMRFESGDTYSIISGNDQMITVENGIWARPKPICVR